MNQQDIVLQVSLVTRHRRGQLPDCLGCHRPIDTSRDYWRCCAGPATKPQMFAAAQCAQWVGRPTTTMTCQAVLRYHGETLLAASGAAMFRFGKDAGGWRFYAGTIQGVAGSQLKILGPDGQWIARIPHRHLALDGSAVDSHPRLG